MKKEILETYIPPFKEEEEKFAYNFLMALKYLNMGYFSQARTPIDECLASESKFKFLEF